MYMHQPQNSRILILSVLVYFATTLNSFSSFAQSQVVHDSILDVAYEKAYHLGLEQRRKAEAGDADAQLALGRMLTLFQNYDEAYYWYKKSAEQGLAEAQYQVGVCLLKGFGVHVNYTESINWFLRSANQGNINAQYIIGLCYYSGIVLKQNQKEAYIWLKKSADQGNVDAQQFIAENYSKKHHIDLASMLNNHRYIDLGLSVKWASYNIGATFPEDYGSYFAWGESVTKSMYFWNTYKHGKNPGSLTKYNNNHKLGNVDNMEILEPCDDAAHVNWGYPWRMPTIEEWKELYEECTWEFVISNGINGYTVTGPNGNSIFLPMAGYVYKDELSEARNKGLYASSSIASEQCQLQKIGFNSQYIDFWSSHRCYGYSVRPVCP